MADLALWAARLLNLVALGGSARRRSQSAASLWSLTR